MIAHIIGRDFSVKNTATTTSQKYRIIDDKVVTSDFCSCELTVVYTGAAAEFCEVGDFIFLPGRNGYNNFFQIIQLDVDYIEKTVRITAESSLLYWYSQRGSGGVFGHVSEVGKTIAWYLSEFTSAPFSYSILANEIPSVARAGDTTASTAKEALEKTASLFGVDIRMSYGMSGKTVHPYLEIREKTSGHDTGEVLTVGKDITAFTKSEDCSNVVTSVYLRGGVKASKRYDTVNAMTADAELETGTVVIAGSRIYKNMEFQTASSTSQMTDPNVIYELDGDYYRGRPSGSGFRVLAGTETHNGFALRLDPVSSIGQDDYIYTPLPSYDSGDYFVYSGRLVSRSAWAKFAAADTVATMAGFGAEIALNPGDVETTEQAEVLARALAYMDANKGTAVSYECDCVRNVEYDGYYTLVVPEESIYLRARCLSVEESETAGTYKPTFGDFLDTTNAFEVMAKNAGGK